MMTELVTVWNGAHQGCDADLLCTAPLAQKRYDVPLSEQDTIRPPTPTQEVFDARYRVAARLLQAGGWWSVPQLAATLKIPSSAVYVVIQRMRRAGELHRGRPTVAHKATGLVVYRWRT